MSFNIFFNFFLVERNYRSQYQIWYYLSLLMIIPLLKFIITYILFPDESFGKKFHPSESKPSELIRKHRESRSMQTRSEYNRTKFSVRLNPNYPKLSIRISFRANHKSILMLIQTISSQSGKGFQFRSM